MRLPRTARPFDGKQRCDGHKLTPLKANFEPADSTRRVFLWLCRAVRMIKLTETQEITPCGCVRMATIDGDVDLGEARDESIRRRE